MKAKQEAEKLRRKCRLSRRGDVVEVAHMLGLEVYERPLPADEFHEITVKNNIAVSMELDESQKQWAIAHAIGHYILHSRINNIWLRANSGLSDKLERQAEKFAYTLLVDEEEARTLGLRTIEEIASHFGVPLGRVPMQGRLW